MRVTNQIMVNTSLTNLQKSLTALNKFSTQVQTGKKISTASDDPVVASKSMRYKTRLYEIDQYANNVNEANSWLSSTETTLSSTYSILKKMRELVQDCSSETITDSDRTQSLIELKQLRSQLAQEANTNVAGRYILSGFKTDTQVMFTEDTEVTYDIKETLDYMDADSINGNEPGTIKGFSIKLQYGTIAENSISRISLKTSTETIDSSDSTSAVKIKLNYVDQADPNAYNVAAKDDTTVPGETTYTINVIKDTGELVFNEDDYSMLSGEINVEYTKNRFSDGDLNPVHYLQCSEKVTLANTNIGKIENHTINLEKVGGIKEGSIRGLYIGGREVINNDGTINTTDFNVVYCKSTDNTPLGVNEIRICTDSGDIKVNSSIADGEVVQVTSYYKAETNPSTIITTSEVKYTDKLVGTLNNANIITLTTKGTIDNNSINGLEFKKFNTTTDEYDTLAAPTIHYVDSFDGITIGATSSDVYVNTKTGELKTGDLYKGAEVFVGGLFVTKTQLVNEEIKFEVNSNSNIVVNTLAKDVFTTDMIKELDLLINRIENMPRDEVTEFLQHGLTQIDNHIEEVLKQTSNVGSKVNRLELIKSRLDDDKINFKDLQSENEDVDEAEAATNLAIQELVYNAALQATSKVLQQSLLDFLQ